MEMRGQLSSEAEEKISAEIPGLTDRIYIALNQSIWSQTLDLINGTNICGALESLRDAANRLTQIQFCLFEARACLLWHREFSPKPSEENANLRSLFYLDYGTLLLYAAGEDLAFFILKFLNLNSEYEAFISSERGTKISKEKNISSNAANAGMFMFQCKKDHEITKMILQLNGDKNWRSANIYRNTWVHEKPPTITGLDIGFSRKNPIEDLENGQKRMTVLAGTEPRYSIDQLHEIVLGAAKSLANTMNCITEYAINNRPDLAG
ncbi:MAG: hypothetical protein PHQ40_05650 [Anaerolineaceae bacterium]|nr:hypothetical protein [Anaerolineaceae bacterium]